MGVETKYMKAKPKDVQTSSSRRKEEGLDTEIVVEPKPEPKKYRRGGKVKC